MLGHSSSERPEGEADADGAAPGVAPPNFPGGADGGAAGVRMTCSHDPAPTFQTAASPSAAKAIPQRLVEGGGWWDGEVRPVDRGPPPVLVSDQEPRDRRRPGRRREPGADGGEIL